MNRFTLLLGFLLMGWQIPSILAQSATENSSSWTINDIINQERISNPDFSPDGKSIVWVKTRPDTKQDKFVTDLYLTRTDITEKGNFKEIQLTRSKESDNNPLFSRNGEFIYFLSSRKKGKHLWALSTYGGEAFSVDSFPDGISQIQWLNDTVITYVSGEGQTLYEQELKKKKDNVVVVEDSAHMKARRIFSYNLKTNKSQRLTNNSFPARSYTVSRDGHWIVSSHVLSPHYGADGKTRSSTFFVELCKTEPPGEFWLPVFKHREASPLPMTVKVFIFLLSNPVIQSGKVQASVCSIIMI